MTADEIRQHDPYVFESTLPVHTMNERAAMMYQLMHAVGVDLNASCHVEGAMIVQNRCRCPINCFPVIHSGHKNPEGPVLFLLDRGADLALVLVLAIFGRQPPGFVYLMRTPKVLQW